jgi:hypothetical protein
MNMTQEIDLLKRENADLLVILQEMQTAVHQAAHHDTPIHEVERTVWQQVLRLGRALLEHFLTLVGTGDLGERLTLPEGRTVERLEALHPRRYLSIFGAFQLSRTVYGSREGQKIDCAPLDHRLQLPDGVFSYLLQDWDQSLCVEEAFGQAERTVSRMLNLQQSVDSLERMNARMAEAVEAFRAERPTPAAEEEGTLLVSSADGKGVVMRRDEQEQKASAHRTKGEKASRKEMAIVGAVYTVDRHVRTPAEVVAALFGDDRDEPKRQRPRPCHKQGIANLTHNDAAGKPGGREATYLWLGEEMRKRDRGRVKERVHLCDGQEALWEARDQYLPQHNTTNILDLLHVTPRLWQAAHVFYPEKSAAAEAFVRERLLRVLEGKAALVLRGLRVMGTKQRRTGSKKATLAKVCAYLEKNLGRMRYDEYLARGYPIASGVIEGACRHLVKDRMERAGMHWTRSGAQAMLDVRSIHVNGDWEAYQTFRIERETKKRCSWQELVKRSNDRKVA